MLISLGCYNSCHPHCYKHIRYRQYPYAYRLHIVSLLSFVRICHVYVVSDNQPSLAFDFSLGLFHDRTWTSRTAICLHNIYIHPLFVFHVLPCTSLSVICRLFYCLSFLGFFVYELHIDFIFWLIMPVLYILLPCFGNIIFIVLGIISFGGIFCRYKIASWTPFCFLKIFSEIVKGLFVFAVVWGTKQGRFPDAYRGGVPGPCVSASVCSKCFILCTRLACR